MKNSENSRLFAEKCYNKNQINSIAQTSLKGYFVRHHYTNAQRGSKGLFFLQRDTHHSLRWYVVDSAFLQKAWSQKTSPRLYSISPKEPGLPSLRTDSGFDLCHHYGAPENQQDRNTAIQWSLSGNAGTEAFPGPIHSAPVLEAPASKDNSPIGQTARQPESLSVFSSQRQNYIDLRSGFCSNHNLRKTRRCRNRIQSQKARKALLSSLALLRIPFSGVLAWKFKTRRYCKFHWSYPFYQSLFEKSPQNYCQIPYPISDGPRILWEQADTVSGCHRLWLCNCSQTIFQYQKQSSILQVSSPWEWLGSRRIQRESPLQVEKETSVCSGKTTYSRGSRGSQAIDSFQGQEVYLPCLCYQSQNESLASLSLLQTKGDGRKEYQRTPLRLSNGQNPHRQLDIQRRLLSASSLCRRYCSLVQKIMFTQGISYYNIRNYQNRFYSNSCKTGQETKTEHRKTPSRFSLSERIFAGISKNLQVAFARKISFLQVIHKMISSIFNGFRVKNVVFTHF